MHLFVLCEHIPKTATAKNKATNCKKGGMLGKKKILFSQDNGSVGRPETEILFGAAFWPMWPLLISHPQYNRRGP